MTRKSIGMLVAIVALGLALGIWGAGVFAAHPSSNAGVTTTQVLTNPVVRTATKSDVSPPLRDIAPIPPAYLIYAPSPENPPLPRLAQARPALDPIRQSRLGPLVMPTPIQNFDGAYNQNGPIPPDTNGEVGRNHYLQIVNSMFQVFSKTGTSLYGPANINTLFTGFGGPCEVRNDGDPIALYDQLADRWIVTQFTSAAPYYQCFALSTSGDPLGSWYRYAFFESNTVFGDYPHLGVWPDAYYMATNEFSPGFSGDGNYAFERDRMLRGDPTARMVYFHGIDGGKLPSDLDGFTPPPAGSPNYFMEWYNNNPGQLAEYKFHVDWTNPASSTYTGPTLLAVSNFTPAVSVPQPGTTAMLASLSDRIMFRVAYRNMGAFETLVLNHSVSTGGVDGVRWYEVRSPNTTPTVFQEGTYAPADGVYRWMGSIAMDHAGDIAAGFSASSSTLFPSIRYAGRLVGDPVGQFSQGEATLLAGTGSEDFPAAPRWGDYSDITVDPADDCTFWYTTEYFSQTSLRSWRTRIGSFKFPSCTNVTPPTPPPATGTPATSTPTPSVTPTFCAGSLSFTGTITNGTSLTQTGRLGLFNPVSFCNAPKTVAGLSDTLTRHYNSYPYTNSSGAAQCVRVDMTQACGNNAVQSIAYLGSFNPNNIQANYLADGGAAGAYFSYSFTLPAGQTAVIVVVEVSPNLGCQTYTLNVNNCAPLGSTATPTPTAGTPSATPVITPSPTPTTVCVGTTYQAIPTTGTMITATNSIGNSCDDCTTTLTLPFPVMVYGSPFSTANVSSNGNIQFTSNNGNYYGPLCLPIQSGNPQYTTVLFPYYDDLMTIMTGTNACPGCGIYTSTVGIAPNRQYVIRWNTTYFRHNGETNFEVVFNESSPTISYIYGAVGDLGQDATVGTQLNLGQYTQYRCQSPTLTNGLRVDFVPAGCPSPTPRAGTPTATPTHCAITFTDVDQNNPFYPFIRCLACRGIISGYSDGTYRWGASVTRGQLSKIISGAAGENDVIPTTRQTFEDVPNSNPFYVWIERLYLHGAISGYTCGGAGEPCVPPGNRPYFRWGANATRGQIAKIDAIAAGYTDTIPTTQQSFEDVPPSNPFWYWIQELSNRGIISGYTCGGAGEPCVPPGNRPYFRWGADATRGQMAKIAAQTFFPGCSTPARK